MSASPRPGGLGRGALALAFAVLLLSASGCSRSHPPTSANTGTGPAIDVQLSPVVVSEAERFVEVPGTIRPVDRAVLAPRVMGVIDALSAGLGQNVRRGEVLARIASRDLAARLAQAEAHLAQIMGDLKREQSLFASGAGTADTVRTLETQKVAAQAAVDEARTLLEYTAVLAPFDGTVTRKYANEGDLATPGTPLLEVEGLSRLRAEVDVPESLAQIAPGTKLQIRTGADTTFEGTLAEISPSADTSTRTALAKVDLPPDAPVRSGQFVRVDIPSGKARSIVAPASAVVPLGQMERVFVVADGRAHLRLVRTGARRGDAIEILAGLNGGESVIVAPPPALRDGREVISSP